MNFHGPQAFDGWQGTSCDLLCGINWVEQRPEPRREVLVIRTRTQANTHWQTGEHTLWEPWDVLDLQAWSLELPIPFSVDISGWRLNLMSVVVGGWPRMAQMHISVFSRERGWGISFPKIFTRKMLSICSGNILDVVILHQPSYQVQDRGKYEHESGIW